jgi:hypothetical protein
LALDHRANCHFQSLAFLFPAPSASLITSIAASPQNGNVLPWIAAFSEDACLRAYLAAIPWMIIAV